MHETQGWTCAQCSHSVAGPYAKCSNCDYQPQRKPSSTDRIPPLVAPPRESQRSIIQWADNTFGRSTSPIRQAGRAVEEMLEFIALYEDFSDDPTYEKIQALQMEGADVVIVLYRFIGDAIDRKMAINRKRKWRSDGTGHGYHIKDD
jgi:hypothetical protein